MNAEFWMVVTEQVNPNGAPGSKVTYTLLHRGPSSDVAENVFKASAPPTWMGTTYLLRWSSISGIGCYGALGRDGPNWQRTCVSNLKGINTFRHVVDKAVEAYYMEAFSKISHDGPICLADPIGECQVPQVVTPEPK